MSMVEIIISKEMISKATQRVDKFQFDESKGMSRFGSEKERTLFGYLGEEMVIQYLKIDVAEEDYEFDLLYRSKKMEVKSVSCKFKPPSHYLCTVNSYDLSGVHKQEADYYIFCRILNDKSKGWILGFIECDQFFKKGTFVPKGSNVFPGQRFDKANATVMRIEELRPVKDLPTI
jgi:hypothetical protein